MEIKPTHRKCSDHQSWPVNLGWCGVAKWEPVGAGAWGWGSGMHGNLNGAKSQAVRAAVDILEVNAAVAGRGFRGHHAMPVA